MKTNQSGLMVETSLIISGNNAMDATLFCKKPTISNEIHLLHDVGTSALRRSQRPVIMVVKRLLFLACDQHWSNIRDVEMRRLSPRMTKTIRQIPPSRMGFPHVFEPIWSLKQCSSNTTMPHSNTSYPETTPRLSASERCYQLFHTSPRANCMIYLCRSTSARFHLSLKVWTPRNIPCSNFSL